MNKIILTSILSAACLLIVTGLFNLIFDHTLNAFYTPSKALRSAEILYNKVSNLPSDSPKFITVTADNQENLLREEEKITDLLAQNGIYFLSVSKFVPSESRQKENCSLVKTLYQNNLDKFGDLCYNYKYVK